MLTFTPATSPLGKPAHRKSPVMARLMAKVALRPSSACWWWQGHVSRTTGYGQASSNGRVTTAHRAFYEQFVGPIPAGMHLDHICRNRQCVKPAHLEPVTQGENNRRSWAARKAAR